MDGCGSGTMAGLPDAKLTLPLRVTTILNSSRRLIDPSPSPKRQRPVAEFGAVYRRRNGGLPRQYWISSQAPNIPPR